VDIATDYWVSDRFVDSFGTAVAYADGFDYCYMAPVVHVVRTGPSRVVARECCLIEAC